METVWIVKSVRAEKLSNGCENYQLTVCGSIEGAEELKKGMENMKNIDHSYITEHKIIQHVSAYLAGCRDVLDIFS